jgi:glycosyltransferase involved in cell wall biosynthesis
MRVLILNHYYWPDVSANAQYGTQLAEDLVRAGMEVHAIASAGDYLGRRKTPLARYEEHNGVRIHRVPVTNFGKGTAGRRVLDAASFHFMAFLVAMRLPRPDVLVTQTAPLLIVASARWISWLRRSRLLVWCQDVWPDIAFALGLFRRKSYSGRIFRLISRASMRRADRIAAIGRCMQVHLAATLRAKPGQIVYFPNWGDDRDLKPVAHEENAFRRSHGLDGRCVVLYSGNMGWGHPFESIMEAASRLAGDERIRFLLIGDGQRRPYIEDYVRGHELGNVILLPYQPYEQLSLSLSAGDVHLISLDERLDGLIIPSKLYGALAVARPVLFLGSERNEIAYVLRDTGCGRRIDPSDPAALVDALLDVAERAGEWRERGRRGYEHFLRTLTREQGTGRYVRLLRELAERR